MIISLLFSQNMLKKLALIVSVAVTLSACNNNPTAEECYQYGQSLLKAKIAPAISLRQRAICDTFLHDSHLDIYPKNNDETTRLRNWLKIEFHKIYSDILSSGRYFDWDNDAKQLKEIIHQAQTFDDIESIARKMREFMESVAIRGESPYFTDTSGQ